MGSIEFGFGEEREYIPNHGGVNWHEVFLRKHEDTQPVWAECFDELGEFCEQMTQENCAFYINRSDHNFDALVVIDHRDNEANWWLTRGQMGSDAFQELFDSIGDEVMVAFTKYPMKKVAEYVLQQMQIDVELLESFPDGWTTNT